MTQTASPPRPPRSAHRPDTRSTIAVSGAAAAIAALLVTGLAVGPAQPPPAPGVPAAPLWVSWGVLAGRSLLDLAMTAAIGLGLVPLMFNGSERTAASRVVARAYRVATGVAVAWCACALSSLVLQAVELAPTVEPGPELLITYVREIGAAQALLTNAALALVVLAVGLVGVRVGGLVPARLLIAGGTAGVLPLVAASHASEGSAALDELTMVALELHVFAAAIWTGGLWALVLLLARQRALLARALPRYSRVAGACLAVVAASGLLIALVRLAEAPTPLFSSLFGTPYGYMLLGKIGCLGLLAVLGAHIRFRLLPVIERARPAGFVLWAGVELAVMGAAFALAVALSRSPI